MLRRILREPLLHFLLLGTGLFLVFSLMPRDGGSGQPGEIVVSQGQIEHLAAGFAKAWQRPPSAQELAGMVDDFVREEIYYREALALGLDRDDTVIRRRLRQKVEFILDDVAAQIEPSDAELEAYLKDHPESFRTPAVYSFHQIFLNRDQRGAQVAIDAGKLLAQLNDAGADASALGDASMLPAEFVDLQSGEIARQFGDAFAASLAGIEPGRWTGPIESGFGVHLVRVDARTDAALPELADVRALVRREWENARRLELNDLAYEQLLKRYSVTIEDSARVADQGEAGARP